MNEDSAEGGDFTEQLS